MKMVICKECKAQISTLATACLHCGATKRKAANATTVAIAFLGVTLLAHLGREAATRRDADWDMGVLEMHHRNKVDAPSGTALLLGEAAAEGRAIELAKCSERGLA